MQRQADHGRWGEAPTVAAVDAVAHEGSRGPAALGIRAASVRTSAAAAITPLPSYDYAAMDHVTSGLKLWRPPPNATVVQGAGAGGRGGRGGGRSRWSLPSSWVSPRTSQWPRSPPRPPHLPPRGHGGVRLHCVDRSVGISNSAPQSPPPRPDRTRRWRQLDDIDDIEIELSVSRPCRDRIRSTPIDSRTSTSVVTRADPDAVVSSCTIRCHTRRCQGRSGPRPADPRE